MKVTHLSPQLSMLQMYAAAELIINETRRWLKERLQVNMTGKDILKNKQYQKQSTSIDLL